MQAKSYRYGICGNGKPALDVCIMDIAEIEARMAAKGIKQVDLANAIGISPVTVNKSFRAGRLFKHHEMVKIEALLGGSDPVVDGAAVRNIPLIGQVAAGGWREAIESPAGWVPVADASAPKNTFALTVVGDSMDLEIQDGGVVIVDPDDKALFPGRLYVVLNDNGETTFKQFEADPARLEPRSTNTSHTAIPLGDGTPFTLVGRVIALNRTR